MALNDQRDKLNTAHDYLLQYSSSSQEFEAALEHLVWVRKNDPESRAVVASIVKDVIDQRREEKHTMQALLEAFQ